MTPGAGVCGCGSGCGCGLPVTTAVAGDVASVLPPGPVAVTTTRMVEPTSAATRSYVGPVAPGMSTQAAPVASQRCHWRVRVIGPLPVQVPSSAVSVSSSRGVPVIAGSAEGSGAVGPVTTSVWLEVASAEPPAFVPVTRTRSVAPMSSAVTS